MSESNAVPQGLPTVQREMADSLRACPLFTTLADLELEQIAALCRWDTYQPQQVIFHQGEPSESLYIMVDGEVALVRRFHNKQTGEGMALTIAFIARGKAFGWLSLVEPRVHIASAVCQSSATLLVIDGARLRLILEKSQRVGFEVMDNLAKVVRERLVAAYKVLESKVQSQENDINGATTDSVNQS